MKKRISIILNQALAARFYLRTPVFDILRSDKDNLITLYTPAKKLKEEFMAANVRVRGCRLLLGLKQSDIIILPEWHTDESRRILEMAVRWGIKTFFAQAGPAHPSAGYKADLYPDRICAWGDMAVKMYQDKGVGPGRIRVTGSPRFDIYHNFKAKRLFSSDKKILLFATQAIWQSAEHHPGARKVIVEQLDVMRKACDELSVQLVCKLHPSDDPALYKKEGVIVLEDTGVSKANYVRGYCSTGYNPSEGDLKNLADIISSCDVAVTLFSTAGLEAMILGKPVIFFDSAGFYKTFEANRVFIEKCAFALAENKKEFIRLFKKYMDNPDADSDKRRQVVFDCAYKQDGQASRRVVDAIEELL